MFNQSFRTDYTEMNFLMSCMNSQNNLYMFNLYKYELTLMAQTILAIAYLLNVNRLFSEGTV